MAEAKRKFYASNGDGPEVVTVLNDAAGNSEKITFKGGVFETSNPLYIAFLEQAAAAAGHPVTDRAPARKES